MKKLYLVGASGHAKVIYDIALKTGMYELAGVFDDDEEKWGTPFLDTRVIGGSQEIEHLDPASNLLFVAIGRNAVRRRIGESLKQRGFELPALVHPSAQLAFDVQVDWGTAVMANAVVNTSSVVGPLAILNTGCTVDHDNAIGTAAHVGPGAHLSGTVAVGEESFVGVGASVRQNLIIGARCMIGGGAFVTKHVPDDSTVVGVPARPV